MGVSQYPVLESGPINWGLSIDGKRLARASDKFVDVARRSGVPTLFDFYSSTREEAEAEWGPEYVESGEITETWFDAREGLRTIHALLRYCCQYPARLAEPAVVEDLQAFEAILVQAATQGVRWHLGQDS